MLKHSGHLAAIRALCNLGLPGEQLIPAVLEALHRAVPSARNLFDWCDARGNLVRYYFEGPIDFNVARHYFAEYYNRREREAMRGFSDAVMNTPGVRSASELEHDAFFRSGLYCEIWRPQGLHRRVEAIVRGSRQQPLGSLVLYRGPDDPPFSLEEEAWLGSVVDYVARGLEAEATAPDDYVVRRDGYSAVTLSPDGALQHVSANARKTLLLAHGGITPDAAARDPRADSYPTLRQLVRELRQRTHEDEPCARAAVENGAGRFVFVAQPLASVDDGAPAAIHVTLQHCESRAVAVRRVLDALPLSAAQKEVCALLHRGQTQAEVAARLSIASSTVADHVKKVYARLDVHSAHELATLIDRATRSAELVS